MDIFDHATELEELHREKAIGAAREAAGAEKYNGRCLNCNEPVPVGTPYCDKWCAEDHELQLAARLRARGRR